MMEMKYCAKVESVGQQYVYRFKYCICITILIFPNSSNNLLTEIKTVL